MRIREEQYIGCVLGLAYGDALGAPYEGGVVEQLLWRSIGRTASGEMRWTDDTQMALDLANSLIAKGKIDQEDLAQRFAASYRWDRGYGPAVAKVLKRIKAGQNWKIANTAIYPNGSYGNGAAMRSPIMALYMPGNLTALMRHTKSSAEVTHVNPLGIEGARIIAVATAKLLHQVEPKDVINIVLAYCQLFEFKEQLDLVRHWLTFDYVIEPQYVVSKLGNGMTALTSCVTAIYIALYFLDKRFEAMLSFVQACEGDVDTIGAMAGAMWGAFNGHKGLPKSELEARDSLINIAQILHIRFSHQAHGVPTFC